jgi:hypothetical protein
MIEAGAPSTEEAMLVHREGARPTGGSHDRITDDRAQRSEGAEHRPCQLRREPSAAKDSIVAGIIHLASLQRGSLILREDCRNVVTKAPTVGTDSVVPNSKRERGVHARYALLGTRSSGGSKRPGSPLGVVRVGPPLTLAACRRPGLACSTLPRPVNGERGAG